MFGHIYFASALSPTIVPAFPRCRSRKFLNVTFEYLLITCSSDDSRCVALYQVYGPFDFPSSSITLVYTLAPLASSHFEALTTSEDRPRYGGSSGRFGEACGRYDVCKEGREVRAVYSSIEWRVCEGGEDQPKFGLVGSCPACILVSSARTPHKSTSSNISNKPERWAQWLRCAAIPPTSTLSIQIFPLQVLCQWGRSTTNVCTISSSNR